MTDLLVIANGRMEKGFARRRWDRAEARLREIFGNGVEVYFTRRAGDGTHRAREALRGGTGWLAAAGGDGTIHDVVNAFFQGDRNIQPGSCLSFLPCGSGNDWARTIGVPMGLQAAVERLGHATMRAVDAGLARFRNAEGALEERVFLNFAEAGAGATLAERRHGITPVLGGRLGYWPAALWTALRYRRRGMQLVLDGTKAIATGPALSLIVAGGCYIGAGMHCAPMARQDDGFLDVITLGDFGPAEILRKGYRFFTGRHLSEAKVSHHAVRTLEAISGDRIPLELDGEPVGCLPLTVRVLPRALRVRY